MSVEQARSEYQDLEFLARIHEQLCPLLAEPCELDRDPWLDVEAASIQFDLNVAHLLVGPRPSWIWPSWLFGQAGA